jgi:hypothetical protein
MPKLLKDGHEFYAQGRATGLAQVAAYEKAGYSPDSKSASRLERRPEVAARIAELRERDPDKAAPGAVMVRLLRLADACDALGTVAALKEGRLALLEALRLQAEVFARQQVEAANRRPMERELTIEEWIMRHGLPEQQEQVMAGTYPSQTASLNGPNPGVPVLAGGGYCG